MQPQINFNTSKTEKPLFIVDAQLAIFAEDPAEAQDKAGQYLANWITFQHSSVLVDGSPGFAELGLLTAAQSTTINKIASLAW